MNVADKVKILKLVGDMIARPSAFNDQIQIVSFSDDNAVVEVTLALRGELAELARGYHVKRTVEEAPEG